MPRKAKWGPGGTSDTPKAIDLKLAKGVRVQVTSGVLTKAAYEARVHAIKEAWGMGGVWAEAVRALIAKRFTVGAFYTAKADGVKGIEALLARAGSEPLKDLARDYLKQSKATDKKNMRQRLDRFAKSLGKSASVADVTTANVEVFLTQLTDQRTATTKRHVAAKGSTVNRYRAVLGGMCTWAVRAKRMQAHPIAGKQIEKAAEPHYRLPEMRADEYRDYMRAVRDARPDLAPLLLLLIHTAPDVGELWKIVARDVDMDAKRMRYERSKTARYGALPRFVPMPAVVLEEMRAHLAEHGLRGSQPVFAMFPRKDVEWLHRRATASIQRPELTMKDLRHVAAIAWVKAGVHIRLVQKWLGHRSLGQTMKYTDYEPGAEMAAEMAERAANTLNETADVIPLRKAQ